MRARIATTLLLLGGLGLAGCAVVDLSAPGSLSGVEVLGSSTASDRQIVVSNSGLYFLGFVFVSGDLTWDAEAEDIVGGWRWFDDQSRVDCCYATAQEVARREGRDLVNVVLLENSSTGVMTASTDLMSLATGAAGAIFGLYEVQASAILRARAPRPEATAGEGTR